MNRDALVKQSDVTRILKGAAAAGIRMRIVVNGHEVHFVPADELAVIADDGAETDNDLFLERITAMGQLNAQAVSRKATR